MNSPVMQGLNLQVPAYVKNARLIAWVAEMAALTQAGPGLLVRRQRGRVRPPVRSSWSPPAPSRSSIPAKRPNCYLACSDPSDVARVEDRTFICSREEGRRRPDQQLDGARRDARARLAAAVRRLHARPHDVRGAVLDGPAGLADRAHRRRAVRQPVCRRQHAHHDAHGPAVYDVLGADGEFVPCVHSVGAPLEAGQKDVPGRATRPSTSCTTPRRARSGRYGSGYGGNALLGKKCFALRIASHHGPRRKAGWPSTC